MSSTKQISLHLILGMGLICFLLVLTGCVDQGAQEKKPVTEKAQTQAIKIETPPIEKQLTDKRKKVISTSPTGRPKIIFENVEYDFGEVSTKTKYTASFKFSNQGDGELMITKVGKCCGAVVKLDKRKFAPQESAEITVQYTMGSYPGTWKKTIDISTNDPQQQKVRLTSKAKIVPKLVWQPSRLRLTLEKENGGCPDLTISCLDDEPFSIKSISATGNCIAFDYDPNISRTQYILRPQVDMEKLKSNLKGRIHIVLTRKDYDIVSVLYDVLPNYSLNRSQIMIMGVEPNKVETETISILDNYPDANGMADFQVDKTYSRRGTAKVVDISRIRAGYRLTVEITPPKPHDSYRRRFMDQLMIKTHDGKELSVLVQGIYASKVFSQNKTSSNSPSGR